MAGRLKYVRDASEQRCDQLPIREIGQSALKHRANEFHYPAIRRYRESTLRAHPL